MTEPTENGLSGAPTLRAVLFDCDGTIADSAGLICDIMERCFENHGLEPPTRAATRSIIGLSLETAIGVLNPGLAPSMIEGLAEAYRTEYRLERTRPQFADHLFEGMADLVRDLAARDGVFVGMVTGKSRRGVAALTASHGLTDMFSAVRTADDCPSKPHPAMVLECCDELGIAPPQAIVVGDTTYDMEMARSAGSLAVGVDWGSHTPKDLTRTGASVVVTTVRELAEALEGMLASETAIS